MSLIPTSSACMTLTALLILGACDGEAGTDAGGLPPDGAIERDAASREDAGEDASVAPVAWIGEALASCTRPGEAGGTARGMDLRRVDIDLDVFPEARCADGTGAVFYVRRASAPGSAARWLIQLQGGGACSSPDSCAQRWCSEGTNFGADKLSSQFAPEAGTRAEGVLAARPDNPFQTWNHVFVHYCSSDLWTGRQAEVELDATHPIDAEPVRFRAAFQGASIVDAVVATLRGEAGSVMAGPDALPDLDEADEVVLAGASAGGAGVIYNLDRVAADLREHNVACDGATCPLSVYGLIDSIYGVRLDRLDFSSSSLCAEGLCTWEAFSRADDAAKRAIWAPSLDDSCDAWHAAEGSPDGFRCTDNAYVIEHHVTTPFILRMGLTDSLIGGGMAERGFSVPERGGAAIDIGLFAELVSEQLVALPDLPRTANEGASMTRSPGVYGPACPKHETLSDGPNTYAVRVEVSGTPVSFAELIQAWRADAGGVTSAVTVPGVNPSTCP
ncbi:MAG: hypothetical protein EVA89_12475 [Sandaracinaceae bacterium]|nr:MAG: hypothetical protein EVA89_12475 [Sandaracinaceae bacterium]